MSFEFSEKKLKDGQEIRVYRNLRKNVFSIQDKKTCKVIAYADKLLLANVEMKIGQAGQQRVRRERQKNVHAFIAGTFVEKYSEEFLHKKKWRPIYYNPYETDYFIDLESGQPILNAKYAFLEYGRCYILDGE